MGSRSTAALLGQKRVIEVKCLALLALRFDAGPRSLLARFFFKAGACVAADVKLMRGCMSRHRTKSL